MTPRREGGTRLTTSLVVGLLLVPLSAVAAFGLVSRQDGAGSTPTAPAQAAAAQTVPATAPVVVIDPVTGSDDDLALACGDDGLRLVALETDGAATEVQRAALDALRQICSEVGLALPAPAPPPAVIRTVTVDATPESTTSTAPPSASEDEHEEDGEDHRDEDHEDESHEDEDED